MKNKQKSQVSVSGLVTKYIEPLLTGNEDTDEYLKKAQIGRSTLFVESTHASNIGKR